MKYKFLLIVIVTIFTSCGHDRENNQNSNVVKTKINNKNQKSNFNMSTNTNKNIDNDKTNTQKTKNNENQDSNGKNNEIISTTDNKNNNIRVKDNDNKMTKNERTQLINNSKEIENRGPLSPLIARENHNISLVGSSKYIGNSPLLSSTGKSIIFNEGTITNDNDKNKVAMSSSNGGEAINNGRLIDLTMDGSLNSVVKNNGLIKLDKEGFPAMEGSFIYNNGTIELRAPYLVGLQLLGYSEKDMAENNGIISIFSHGDTGIMITQGVGVNNKILNINGEDNIGILLSSEKGNVNNNGTININNKNNVGIQIFGNEDYLDIADSKNTGIININGSKNIGLEAYGASAQVSNNKSIIINGNSNIGIKSEGKGHYNPSKIGVGINLDTIIMGGESNIGIIASSSGKALNNKNININGDRNKGMVADGKGSIAINRGTINLKGHNNIAMYANNFGKIVNDIDGVIYLSGESNFKYTQYQTGRIHEESYTDPAGYHHSPETIPIYSYKVSSLEDIKDSNGNRAFKIENNGSFENKGKIIIGKKVIKSISDIKVLNNKPGGN